MQRAWTMEYMSMNCTNCSLKIRISLHTKAPLLCNKWTIQKAFDMEETLEGPNVAFQNTGWGHSRGQASCWRKVDRSLLVIGYRCFNHIHKLPKNAHAFHVKVLAYRGTQSQDVSTKQIAEKWWHRRLCRYCRNKRLPKIKWSCSTDATKHVYLFPCTKILGCRCCRPETIFISSLCAWGNTLQGTITYPTFGKGKLSSKKHLYGICLFPGGYHFENLFHTEKKSIT